MQKRLSDQADLIDLINDHVQVVLKTIYKEDVCPPVYFTSLLGNKIILTCVHAGSSVSEIVFPQPDMTYGMETIKTIMERLYSRTM